MIDAWSRAYKEAHPAAGEWARGSKKVCHSRQTQERVFRMAEQLRVTQDWANVGTFFSMLQALDEVVDNETCRTCQPSPISAAAAGIVGYKMLFGKLPPLQDRDWPAGFVQIDDREAELAALGLRARGFDPIVIDGIDPAAYLWGIFEMCERKVGCAEVRRLQQHAAMEPRCVAATPALETTPTRAPATRARDLVTAGS